MAQDHPANNDSPAANADGDFGAANHLEGLQTVQELLNKASEHALSAIVLPKADAISSAVVVSGCAAKPGGCPQVSES